jgi:hypothetical protein
LRNAAIVGSTLAVVVELDVAEGAMVTTILTRSDVRQFENLIASDIDVRIGKVWRGDINFLEGHRGRVLPRPMFALKRHQDI